MSYLSDDSIAILLLCSNLAINIKNKERPKPFTTLQWQKFSEKILNSKIERPSKLLNMSRSDIEKAVNLSVSELDRIEQLLVRKINLAIEVDNLRSKGIMITTRAEKNYPIKFKRILKKKCPPVIYFSGDIGIANMKSMGVVGSRNIDESGEKFTKLLAEKCVSSKLAIVSGGARGVDSISEESTIMFGGRVVSVVSDSLAKKIMIKRNRSALLEGRLLMMSIVHPNATFKGYNAMERNKYIYALSDVTTVVASDYNKGGTWSGAVENLKNNWVPLLVRYENKIPEGNHELIKLGGIILDYPSIQNDFTSYLTNIEKCINNESEVQTNLFDSIENKVDTIDLYKIVIETILDNTKTPQSIEEFSNKYNVLREQMDVWINKATKEGLLIRLADEEKYIKKNEGKA